MPTGTPILDPHHVPARDPAPRIDQYRDLLVDSYDCVDRIVLTAYNSLCHSPAGFRFWWRQFASEDTLDDAHLMQLAGRFARRVRAWAKASGVPLIECARGVRKHQLAEAHLSAHGPRPGVFLILVARAPATVYAVRRSAQGVIYEIEKKRSFVNHYSFHLWDAQFGHLTIKMSGHPPFGAQVMLNGHEAVACAAQAAGLGFTKERNCFTAVADPVALAHVADTLASEGAAGRLREVVERWIYSACLVFGLDLAEQERSRFRYDYSVFQVEYSRNLLFRRGDQMEEVFQAMLDRHRGHLDLREVRTIFGKGRHATARSDGESVVRSELARRPQYGLTVFKLDFGRLTLKAYTKGERVLRFETIAHNTKELHCGRRLVRFGEVVARLRAILERALAVLRGMERAFVSDDTLERLPRPAIVGRTRVGGIDIGKPRTRVALALALAAAPAGFTAGELAAKARELGGAALSGYDSRRAAYDLKKMRGKNLVTRIDRSHRYQLLPDGVATITALVVLRDKVLRPLLAAMARPFEPIRLKMGRKPCFWDRTQDHYQRLRRQMYALLTDLQLLPDRQTFVDPLRASA